MYPPLLRRVLLPGRCRRLNEKIARYEQPRSRAEIERIQVQRFNEIWAYCLAEVPFYRSWRSEHGLPDRIGKPSDLASFPLLDKEVLISRSDEIFQYGRVTDAYSTGGSTGQPARYPRSAAETTVRYVNNYLGRAWWGVRPFDSQVLLWGHAHLFGLGLRGQVAQIKRRLADRIVNITRCNAYDLTESSLHSYYEALVRRDPILLGGYASAVFRLACHIERRELCLPRRRRLRAVVLCAETVSDADLAMVERVFRAPAVIDYGAAETGLIAMSRHRSKALQILWDSFICLVAEDSLLNITTLDPRIFPLVNYAIGDRVVPDDIEDGNALWLRSVLGREQDLVRIGSTNGVLTLSAIMPVHILKSYRGIIGVQFRQVRPDALEIRLQGDRELDLAHVSDFFIGELRKDHPDVIPTSVTFRQVAEPAKTLAGKHLLFVP